MSRSLAFEVQRRLEQEDLGERQDDGTYVVDLTPDRRIDTYKPHEVAPNKKRVPKTRAEREKVAEQMAAQLMDYFMHPAQLNDMSTLNPIRDGIPQCSKHPFVKGDGADIGCIHSCGKHLKDMAGAQPVARDGDLGDAWRWVRALVVEAVTTQDKRLGFAQRQNLTPGR